MEYIFLPDPEDYDRIRERLSIEKIEMYNTKLINLYLGVIGCICCCMALPRYSLLFLVVLLLSALGVLLWYLSSLPHSINCKGSNDDTVILGDNSVVLKIWDKPNEIMYDDVSDFIFYPKLEVIFIKSDKFKRGIVIFDCYGDELLPTLREKIKRGVYSEVKK